LTQEIKRVAEKCPTLKTAAFEMLQKLEDYQAEAQKKEVYYWTTILDPRIKLNVFKSEVFTKKKVKILYSRRNFLILFTAQFSEHKKELQGSSRKVQSTRRVCAWLCSSDGQLVRFHFQKQESL